MDDARLDRAADAPRGVAAQRHAERRAAVIGMPQRDDFVRARIAARGENGGLVRFCAAVGEERFRQLPPWGQRGEPGGERGLRFGREDRGDVREAVDLLVNGLVHARVRMAHADGDDTPEEVQVLPAVRVVDELVPGAGDDEGFAEVVKNRGEKEFLVGEENLFFGHTRMVIGIPARRSAASTSLVVSREAS